MKVVLNVLRFILFVPVCLALLWLMYFGIGAFVWWLDGRSTLWLIFIIIITGSLISWIGSAVIGFLSYSTSRINPYKELGLWVMIPLAIVLAIYYIIKIWGSVEVEYTRHIIVALCASGLIIYCTLSFCNGLALTENETR